MKYSVTLHGRDIRVEVSALAETALAKRDQPVIADVHLVFACMPSKRVWFKEQVDVDWVKVSDNLGLSFQAVKYDVCSLENMNGGSEPKPFPLGRPLEKFIPNHVSIDFKDGALVGDFTFNRNFQAEIS